MNNVVNVYEDEALEKEILIKLFFEQLSNLDNFTTHYLECLFNDIDIFNNTYLTSCRNYHTIYEKIKNNLNI